MTFNQFAQHRIVSLVRVQVTGVEVGRELASPVRYMSSSEGGALTLVRFAERALVETLFGYGTRWNFALRSSLWGLS